jgi:hypothetical protein
MPAYPIRSPYPLSNPQSPTALHKPTTHRLLKTLLISGDMLAILSFVALHA